MSIKMRVNLIFAGQTFFITLELNCKFQEVLYMLLYIQVSWFLPSASCPVVTITEGMVAGYFRSHIFLTKTRINSLYTIQVVIQTTIQRMITQLQQAGEKYISQIWRRNPLENYLRSRYGSFSSVEVKFFHVSSHQVSQCKFVNPNYWEYKLFQVTTTIYCLGKRKRSIKVTSLSRVKNFREFLAFLRVQPVLSRLSRSTDKNYETFVFIAIFSDEDNK